MAPSIDTYIRRNAVREPESLARLREATLALPNRYMQISPETGQVLALLVHMTRARRCLEIGTFTGYSALAVALALPADGTLIACDVSDEWTAIGRRYWKDAGVAQKIDLRLGPALETLDRLIADGGAGTFDMAFIDADKTNYDGYYERVLTLLRPQGIVAIDNVWWGGGVADAKTTDAATRALQALNKKIHADQRVSMAMLAVGDGLTVACKR
jgi:predicted O-methyltransferase YrrM